MDLSQRQSRSPPSLNCWSTFMTRHEHPQTLNLQIVINEPFEATWSKDMQHPFNWWLFGLISYVSLSLRVGYLAFTKMDPGRLPFKDKIPAEFMATIRSRLLISALFWPVDFIRVPTTFIKTFMLGSNESKDELCKYYARESHYLYQWIFNR